MRNLRKTTRGLAAAAAGAVSLFWPARVLAQDAPESPSLNSSAPIWLGLLIIGAMLVVVVIVSMMPSKRSHQD